MSLSLETNDSQIRLAAFNWLTKQTFFKGNVFPYDLIKEGFIFNGQKIHLMGPQGIFKPRQLKLPLSITTSPNSPYKDRYDKDGNLLYSYRRKRIKEWDSPQKGTGQKGVP